MKKNPKTLAGIIALAVLLILSAILAGQMIPTIQETQRELEQQADTLREAEKAREQNTQKERIRES